MTDDTLIMWLCSDISGYLCAHSYVTDGHHDLFVYSGLCCQLALDQLCCFQH